MKATELMIGDWVLMKNKPYKVASLSSIENLELESDKYIFHCLKDEIVPIPLTPEILEKNGFELYEQDFTSNKVYVFDKGFTYIEDCGNYFVIGANVEYEHFGRKLRFISSTIKIYYVHELQHALRLCGINKVITI